MTAPLVYLTFPGTAREALEFYAGVFGGDLEVHSFEEFGRSDGPPTATAHGVLSGVVALAGSDAAGEDRPFHLEGTRLALLGTADADTLHAWFDALAVGGHVLDPLAEKPWGATDGQVVDRYGLHWLIGYEPEA